MDGFYDLSEFIKYIKKEEDKESQSAVHSNFQREIYYRR